MKKIYIYIIISFFILGCTKDLQELNIDPKNPQTVPSATLFSNAEKNLVDHLTTPNVNINVLRLFSQYWTQTTYIDESNYDITTRTIPDNVFNRLYLGVLKDLDETKVVINKEPIDVNNPNAEIERKNQLAIIEILNVYTYQVLVDIFGNVPYTEALDIENPLPKYDDALTIYKDLLSRLNTAISNLDTSKDSFGPADLIYNGNTQMWHKFANSIKIRLAMRLADVSSETSAITTALNEAVPNAFMSNADNAIFQYSKLPPNTNPIWINLVQSGRHDYVPANTIVDKMNTLEDPRRMLYFDGNIKDDNDNVIYKGGIYGASNSYNNYTHVASQVEAPDARGILMTFTDVSFFLAEAAERGFYGSSSDAIAHYDLAITESILYWGGTVENAIDYLANPDVNYNTASGDYKEKIGTQKWLALYNRGFEGWTEYRRLDYPMLVAPDGAQVDIVPTRYTYPINEQTLNPQNYQAASSAIGGDLLTTKLFWDKN
ncbi:SusD/RagB family nutrient-binding outer membrane lipoprotein [Aureivirga sp. CE67]|uniref:SusD/RagB family nutrient-binding outer membrane lipoprotein n=1 Tax=Aureivirga sp. CE67 TaxID=1788983 RepID=UPI0018CAE90A|nr:SusD/RagB family nutrient-binding outer membrane lipoprotein [Aureivirga sp. CE67]